MNLSEKDEIGNAGINKNKMPKIGIADSILKRKREEQYGKRSKQTKYRSTRYREYLL